jgi:hypothetical protein
MTAIVGFNYLDGVLMMADTEETTSEATKSECDKLCRFTFPIGTVITGGAGDSHLIEYANQRLRQFFYEGGGQNPQVKSKPEELLAGLNEFAGKFFRETLGPYKGFAAGLVPTFEMLIALNYDKQSYLFHWIDNRVVFVSQHTAIGSGMIQLHPMLRDVQFAATKESTLFMGLRMMFHAKRIVKSVGGKTEAIALENDGTTHLFGLDTTQQVENLVINFEQFLTKFVYTLVSNISTDVRELEENVASDLKGIPELLRQYRERYRTIMTPPNPGVPEN